jgi:hypothetical protein
VEIILIGNKIDDKIYCVEIILIDDKMNDKIDDKIYCMWKLF